MFVKPNLGSDWRIGAMRFLKYMTEDRDWRRTWLAFGPRFMCVGVIAEYALEDNDNQPVS
jgi:hypothetical protein